MKKRSLSIIGCLVALIAVITMGLFLNKNTAYAAESDDDLNITETTNLNAEYFTDPQLFAALSKIYQDDLGGNLSEVTYGSFKEVESLDLSYAHTGYKIASLDGIEYLYFNKLKTINLEGNGLIEVSPAHFTKMITLETIDLSDNKLETCVLSTTLKPSSVDLSNNKLDAIDLSNMKNDSTLGYATADLSVNDFDKVEDIVLPERTGEHPTTVKLSLAQNYLTDAVVSDFGGHTVSLQLQGMHVGAVRSVSNTYFRLTNDSEGAYTGLTAKLFYRSGSVYYQSDVLEPNANLVSESDQEGRLILQPGKMYLRFYNNGVEINDTVYYSHEIDVYPKAPTMIVKVGKKQVDAKTGDSFKKDFEVIAVTSIKNAKTYIAFSGDEYQQGNTAFIKKRGTYTISAYVTYDGLQSNNATITLRNNNSTGMTWGLIIVIGVIIALVAGYTLIKWFKGGAVVSPLTDKEVRRIEKNKNPNQNQKNK